MATQTYPTNRDINNPSAALDGNAQPVQAALSGEPYTNKRFILIFASIFALGATPLLLQQPSGVASAGLSLGFTFPIERLFDMIVFAGLGIYASFLRAQALILMPLCFILLYVLGMSLGIDAARYTMMPVFMFGSVMLFALSVAIAGRRASVMGILIAASLGFHFGRQYVTVVPDMASPLYFMIGNILSFALIFATAISFGFVLKSGDEGK